MTPAEEEKGELNLQGQGTGWGCTAHNNKSTPLSSLSIYPSPIDPILACLKKRMKKDEEEAFLGLWMRGKEREAKNGLCGYCNMR